MSALTSQLDPLSQAAVANRDAMLVRLARLQAALAQAREGGGAQYVERHRERGKLLVRERVELLIDRDSPFLELQSLIGWGTDYHVGGSMVTGIGVVEDVPCMIAGNDPTVRGGTNNPYGLRKMLRAMEIARVNRLVFINLTESGGADLPSQAELFIPGGALFRNLTRLSASGIPTITLVFGNSTAGGAYVPGMSDYTIFVEGNAKVFLGGPPLVQMATGEIADDEELGGADMHARVSGLADYLARDEHDAIRISREIVRNLNRSSRDGASPEIAEPLYDQEELLAIVPPDLRMPFDPREILARVLDHSRYDEFKPLYGAALTTGWGAIHGHNIGVLANVRGVLFSEEAQKAAQFIQLANQKNVPLLFIHNATGFMVGKQYERGGIVKHGALMINAVSNSRVPHLGIIVGGSYGAANYAMSGRAYEPRMLFSWPTAQSAVMGPAQLAGVLSLVSRASAKRRGLAFDEEADAESRQTVEAQIEEEQSALSNSSRGYDDGIIDPRDTRTILGIALSIISGAGTAEGSEHFGVFRV
jgi:acyl-CoA carboxylase subunit beta